MRKVYGWTAALAAAATAAAGLAMTAAPAGSLGVVTMASVDAAGTPLHKVSDASMSDDGRLVAFIAASDSSSRLMLRNRAANTTTEVWPLGASTIRLSGDGSTLVFQAGGDLKAYDVATGTTTSVGADFGAIPGGVSDDGRFVAFSVNNLSTGQKGVYLRDRAANTTTQVSQLNPTLNAFGYAAGPVSNDGNTVSFTAQASIPGNQFSTYEAFYWQRTGVTGGIASVDNSGVAANRNSFPNDMTPDGRYIVFETDSRLTADDPNLGARDVYVRDLLTATTSYVGANFSESDPRFGSNSGGRISADGTKVAYVTSAQIAGKPSTENYDAVVANRAAGTVELVNIDRNGVPSGLSGGSIDMSRDGRFVTFLSSSLTLVAPFSTADCAEYDDGQVNYGECSNAYVADRAASGAFLPSTGGTVSLSTPTLDAAAQVPNLGSASTVSIAPAVGTQPVPNGYTILGQQLVIDGPTATWNNPLRLTFTIDASLHVAPADVAVIRDGVPMVDCLGSATALADGSPCVTSRGLNADGDTVVVALTPHFSVWTVAKVPPPATKVTFASLCEDTQNAVGQKGIGQSLCAKLAAASAARDRKDGPAAANQLEAYRSEVAAQTGKSMTSASAASLTDKSRLV